MTVIAIASARKYQRLETLVVAVLAACVVAFAVTWAFTRSQQIGPPPLLDWQVSSLADLGEDDQAIHSALIVAGEEIGYLNYDFGDWPKTDELDTLLMPPFYKDEFWKLHGAVKWDLIRAADYNHGGDTGYLGTGGALPGQSAFLLLFRHRHVGAAYANPIDIWIHRNVNANAPADTKAESLVSAGWRQVVAYSGADELARLKGKQE